MQQEIRNMEQHRQPHLVSGLIGYTVFIFLAELPALFLSPGAAANYITAALLGMGAAAVLLQRFVHGRPIADMGFRLNRNVLIGLPIVFLFIGLAILCNGLIPYWLGWLILEPNANSAIPSSISPVFAIPLVVVVGGAAAVIPLLFGEELAFRGYILPKLEELHGGSRAVILCSILFAIWHLPDYFSIYAGSGAAEGWPSLFLNLLAHGVSVVPLCILYLTTRELYGVSVYHAVLAVTQYAIVGDPDAGYMSSEALYCPRDINESGTTALNFAYMILQIPLMWALCRQARRWTLLSRAATAPRMQADPVTEY
jgi:membrane protease YdiL (CAAX protease family)